MRSHVTKFILILNICILSILLAHTVQAQPIDCWPHCEPVRMRPLVESDPPMSKEAFFDFCEKDTKYSNMYDCTCLSQRYDEARIHLGQDAGHAAIKEHIVSTCIDTKRAGDILYDQCVNVPPSTFNSTHDYSVQQYCRCVGDKYAELYKAAPPPYPQEKLNNFQLEAQYFCRR